MSENYYIDSGNGYVYCFSDKPFEGSESTEEEIVRCSDGKFRLASQTTETNKHYDMLVEQEQKKREAQNYLDKTDWYITRYIDIGKEVPEEVKRKRAECRELL